MITLVIMIDKIIKYSFDQKLISHSIEQIPHELKLLKLKFEDKKFVIYFYEIEDVRRGRTNKDERTIQISPRLKQILLSYSAEEYEIILLGYDYRTKTFTIWSYKNLRLQTMQSLYTRSFVLSNAQAKGYDSYKYIRRDPFDRNFKESTWSLSFNMFLLPLILKNFKIVFTKKIFDEIEKKIKHFNNAFDLDELIMCLDIYAKHGNVLSPNDPEIIEVSSLCNQRAKLIEFFPFGKFYHEKSAKKFRNPTGISMKIQNFVTNDPLKKAKGLQRGGKGQQVVWDMFSQGQRLNAKKLSEHSKLIKRKIETGDIFKLVDYEFNTEIAHGDNVSANEKTGVFFDYDFNKELNDRKVNLENITDYLDQQVATDRANQVHETILKKLSKILYNKNLIYKSTKHIDLYSEFENRGKLFEAKSFTEKNLKTQLRHAILQLKEYYYLYFNYGQKIKEETDLFLILNSNPKRYVEDNYIDFIKSENICLCWFENNKICTIDDIWKKNISWLS